MMAGAELVSGRSFFNGGDLEWSDLLMGLPYSLCFLGFLTVHEFGHYLTAVYHKVRCSLPYYIPVFFPFFPVNIGSFGAVIRIRELPSSRRKYFDIGVAGPLAGFVIAVGLLVWGFTHLPPLEEYVFNIHPDYPAKFQGIPTGEQAADAGGLAFNVGGSLLFEFLKNVLPPDPSQVPPGFEIMHYPFIFVGFLTLFFTALNLLPIGQLDGGHVVYGLFGRKAAGIISRIAVLTLVMVGGTGMVQIDAFDPEFFGSKWNWIGLEALKLLLYGGFVYYVMMRIWRNLAIRDLLLMTAGVLAVQAGIMLIFPATQVNEIWLLYSLIAVSMIGVDHPEAPDESPLDLKRKILGWIAILIFILCFAPSPLSPV